MKKNNFLFFYAFTPLFFTACTGGKKAADNTPKAPARTPVTTTYEPAKVVIKVDTVKWKNTGTPPKREETSTPVVVNTSSNSGKLESKHNNYKPHNIVKHEKYNVVIAMPFDAANFKNVKASPNIQAMSVEFYAGALIALYDLKAEGLKLNVNVLDTKIHTNDDLLTSDIMRNADLIIGPLQNEEVKKVADFADKNQIAFISPFNPNSVVQVYPVPNYVQVSPTVESQFEYMLTYFKDKFPKAQFAVVKGSTDNEGQNVEKIKNAFKRVQQDETADITVLTAEQSATWKSKLSGIGQAIIFVPSGRKEFIQSQLSQIGDNAIVIGMPSWFDMDGIGSYIGNKSVYIPRDFYIDVADVVTKDFKRRYWDTYGIMPGGYAYRGYDIMLYFGRCLDEHGIYFKDELPTTTLSKKYMTTQFSFNELHRSVQKPANFSTDVRQYENGFVHILRYEPTTGMFARMNW
ncbi:MAG: hypothetical protein RI894_415 [Bacteroidota bacterium]|jgi:hypothetical protein